MNSNWLIYGIGLFAQGLFSARILVQWILSEREKKVVSPTIFWILSFIASFIFFTYGWLRQDFSIMLGQIIGYYVYVWNLGIKGIWKRIRNGWRQIVLTLILLLPVIAISSIFSDYQNVINTLFKNDNLPIWLLIWGSAGQVIFSLRFVYQFLYSKKRHESILPAGFWIISLVGSMLIVSYGIVRLDPVLILGQGVGLISYTRNLIIWKKSIK